MSVLPLTDPPHLRAQLNPQVLTAHFIPGVKRYWLAYGIWALEGKSSPGRFFDNNTLRLSERAQHDRLASPGDRGKVSSEAVHPPVCEYSEGDCFLRVRWQAVLIRNANREPG